MALPQEHAVSLRQGSCFSGLHTAGELRLTLQEEPFVIGRGSPLVYARTFNESLSFCHPVQTSLSLALALALALCHCVIVLLCHGRCHCHCHCVIVIVIVSLSLSFSLSLSLSLSLSFSLSLSLSLSIVIGAVPQNTKTFAKAGGHTEDDRLSGESEDSPEFLSCVRTSEFSVFLSLCCPLSTYCVNDTFSLPREKEPRCTRECFCWVMTPSLMSVGPGI